MAFPYDVQLFRITITRGDDRAPRTEVLTRVRTANDNLLLFTGYNCRIRQTESCYEFILDAEPYDTTQNLMKWPNVVITAMPAYAQYIEDMYPLLNGPPKSMLRYRAVDANTWEISPLQVEVERCTFSINGRPNKIIFTGSTHIINSTFECTWLTELDLGHAMIRVPAYACRHATELRLVKGPNVYYIGDYAFGKSAILTITREHFPRVKIIGAGAFLGSTSLQVVDMPTPHLLRYDCFNGCTSLTRAVFESVTDLESRAFRNCTSLHTVHFPNTVNVYGTEIFAFCKALTNVAMPEITSINERMFALSGVTDVTFPKATTIYQNAFRGCVQLQRLHIPVATEVMMNAFANCPRFSVTCPPSINKFSFPPGSDVTYTPVFPSLADQ